MDLTIVKSNGKREAYSREKMISGLKKALEKRAITDDTFKKLVNGVERGLQMLRKNEVTSNQIGQIVMKHLKKVDHVAYIRFASVYESFKDAHTFRKELNKLLKNKRSAKKKKE